MGRHAYLIIAHHQLALLCKMIDMIDDERNDIFIHIDKKATNMSAKEINKHVLKSNVYFTKRISVKWGGYSQIRCELILFSEAVKHGPYDYYHVVSGSDLPIKNQDTIHQFFDKNCGKEFVQFQKKIISDIKVRRVKYYYIFQDHLKKKGGIGAKVQELSIRVQHLFKINRIRKSTTVFQMGSNWVSITDDFVKYILSKKFFIRRNFLFTKCCDELFVQTLLINSNFKYKLYDTNFSDSVEANMRLIFWRKGAPKIIESSDERALRDSNCLFARKFDLSKDKKIVNLVEDIAK